MVPYIPMESAAPMVSSRQPKFVRFALLLGIVVILNIFFNAILALVYPMPQYNSYCPVPQPMAEASQAECQMLYQTASEQHALHAFTLMIGLGIAALITGFIPIGSSIVSSGLSYGGVLALIVGAASYWNMAGNWTRLIITAIGLMILLYIGWRRFSD